MAKARPMGADEEMDSGFVKTKRYKAKAGRQDLIVFREFPLNTPRHRLENRPGFPAYMHCLTEAEGKPDACCQALGKPGACATTYLLHLASREKSGQWKLVGEPLVWGFGSPTWGQFQALLRDNFDGDFAKMSKTIISVICQDSNFQKVFLSVYPKADVKPTRPMIEALKASHGMFDDAVEINRKDVLDMLARYQGEEADVEVDADGQDAAGQSDAAEPATNDGVEIDDLIAGLDGDDKGGDKPKLDDAAGF